MGASVMHFKPLVFAITLIKQILKVLVNVNNNNNTGHYFSLLPGVSKYVGDAVKVYGSHDHRKRNAVGITPWGIIENNSDLIGRDVSFFYTILLNYIAKYSGI